MNKLTKPFLNAGNGLVYRVLKSRFHWLLSGKFVLLRTIGRKSGRTYMVPVNFRQMEDSDGIVVMTYRRRQWWRNVRDGGELSVYLRGRLITMTPEVVTDDMESIGAGLRDRGWVRRSLFRPKPKNAVLIRLHIGAISGEIDQKQKESITSERS